MATNPPTTSKRKIKSETQVYRKKLGRPFEYEPSVIDRMLNFFHPQRPAYTESTDKNLVVRQRPLPPPSFTRFAALEGVTKETLYRWSTAEDEEGKLRFPEFAQAYAVAKGLAEAIKHEGAAMRLYDARHINFDLMVNHNWGESGNSVQSSFNAVALEEIYARGRAQMLANEERNRIEKTGLMDVIDQTFKERS